jgi:predicted RNase H-like HicB family nuclease
MSRLDSEKMFENLKEALTFLLNHEFADIVENPDQ